MTTIKATIRVSKGKENAFVRFRLSDGRNVQLFYKSTISVNVSLWDSKKGEISTRKICNNTYRRNTNKAIQETKERLFEIYETNKEYIKNSNDLAKAMNGQKFKDLESPTNVYDICELINEYIKANELSKRTKDGYKTLRTLCNRYTQIAYKKGVVCHLTDIRTITENDIKEISSFICNEYKEIETYADVYCAKPFNDLTRKCIYPKERSENTKIGYLKKFRAIFSFAVKRGLIACSPMDKLNIGRELYGTPYYLTKQERDYLTNFDLSNTPELEKVRDVFIFQCFCGCRIGDLLRLTKQNISSDGKYLEYIPTKTKNKRANLLRIPLHKAALRIIHKYETDTDIIPQIKARANKKHSIIVYLNKKLKEVFKIVGLSRMIIVLNPVTRKEEQIPLYDVVSTHMARRTFIGLLYKQVKDPNIIGSMSGHAPNSIAFVRYREIDDELKNEVINLL